MTLTIEDGSRTVRTSRHSRWNYWSSYLWFPPREGIFQFFIKPHLAAVGIDRQRIPIPYAKDGIEQDTEGYLWSLKIKNRYRLISQSVQDCKGFIYFADLPKVFAMKWSVGVIKVFYKRWELNERDVEYIRFVAVNTIMNQTRNQGDIPAGETQLLPILCTLRDSDIARLVIQQDQEYSQQLEVQGETVHGSLTTPLILSNNKSFKFEIRFNGEFRGKQHTLRINSYDDVGLD